MHEGRERKVKEKERCGDEEKESFEEMKLEESEERVINGVVWTSLWWGSICHGMTHFFTVSSFPSNFYHSRFLPLSDEFPFLYSK